MIKVKSLEVREIEYSYDKRPKISGMDDVVQIVKPYKCRIEFWL